MDGKRDRREVLKEEGKSTRVSYVGIEKPFVKTFATVLLTSLVPDSPT